METDRELITKRIDEATTDNNKWNHWPDKMEIVDVMRYDLNVAKLAFYAGQLVGRASYGAHRQILPANVPRVVGIRPDHWMLQTNFTLAEPRGQGDDSFRRNLFAIFEELPDMRKYDNRNIVVVEIGCKHDYEVKTPYNCYREGKCKKCGHTWACDSGD